MIWSAAYEKGGTNKTEHSPAGEVVSIINLRLQHSRRENYHRATRIEERLNMCGIGFICVKYRSSQRMVETLLGCSNHTVYCYITKQAADSFA